MRSAGHSREVSIWGDHVAVRYTAEDSVEPDVADADADADVDASP